MKRPVFWADASPFMLPPRLKDEARRRVHGRTKLLRRGCIGVHDPASIGPHASRSFQPIGRNSGAGCARIMSPTDGLALPHTPAAGECLQALPGLSRDPRRSRHEHPRRRARLMASPPVLHTVDPLIAGRIELYVDAPPAGVNQIVFYMGTTPGGPYGTEFVNSIVPGVDGTDLIIKADSTRRYWIAKAHDGGGYSGPSNEVSTSASAGPPPPPPPPPPLTQVQHLEAAIGGSYTAGDIVQVFPPSPSLSVTVQADGSIS